MMRNSMRLFLLSLIVSSLLLTWIQDGFTAPAPTKVIKLFMGSTSSSSSIFITVVATARIINRHVPEARITVLETGGTHDNIQRMAKGQIQLAGAQSSDGPIMAYNGTHMYKDKPLKKIRVFFHEREGVLLLAVRVDSGVKTLRDLDGKRYQTGIPGTSGEYNSRLLFKTFGIEPKYIYGSLSDAVEMVKEGRSVGLCKYSPGLRSLDATILDIKSVTPVRLISLTEEEVTKVIPMMPGQFRIDIPSDNPLLKNLGQEGPLIAISNCGSHYVSSELSEELVYKMIKAIAADWKTDIVPTYPESANWDVIRDTIRTVSSVANPVPLHAGVVKYFIERGYKVPDNLLPPEFKK